MLAIKPIGSQTHAATADKNSMAVESMQSQAATSQDLSAHDHRSPLKIGGGERPYVYALYICSYCEMQPSDLIESNRLEPFIHSSIFLKHRSVVPSWPRYGANYIKFIALLV